MIGTALANTPRRRLDWDDSAVTRPDPKSRPGPEFTNPIPIPGTKGGRTPTATEIAPFRRPTPPSLFPPLRIDARQHRRFPHRWIPPRCHHVPAREPLVLSDHFLAHASRTHHHHRVADPRTAG